MGYESRLYVVNKTYCQGIRENEIYYAEVIAQFNLSKVPMIVERIRKYDPTDVYIYKDNGNDVITEDDYGDPLIEIPIEDMIEIIEKVITSDDHYRRYAPCLQLLKGFFKWEWSNLVVLHYGY